MRRKANKGDVGDNGAATEGRRPVKETEKHTMK